MSSTVIGGMPPQTPEVEAQVFELSTNEHPLAEGVFSDAPSDLSLLPLPIYDTEVDSSYRISLEPTIHENCGTTWLEEWQMSDGIRHDVLIGESDNPIGLTVVKNTSLGTQPGGFNTDVARMLMTLGLDVLIIGGEKGGSIPLSHSAYNTHQILDEAEDIGILDSEVIAQEQYSRGSNIGFGVAAYADQFDRIVIYSNFTDPRVAEKLELSPEELLDYLKNLGPEALTLVLQLGKLMLNPIKAWHYRKTVDLSVDGARQFRDTLTPILDGGGGFLARHFPLDSPATVAFFGRKLARDQESYKQILEDHPLVKFRQLGRGHVTGIDKRVISGIERRFLGLTLQLRDGVTIDEIDYAQIH